MQMTLLVARSCPGKHDTVPEPFSLFVRSYTLLSGLQTFAPTKISLSNDGCLPLEVLIDFRCETSDFDRLVPQTDATFHYDKFNRLRLRNNVTSVGVVREHGADDRGHTQTSHLQDQTVRRLTLSPMCSWR